MTWQSDLQTAFVDAFPDAQEFDRMIGFINRRRSHYSGPVAFPDVVQAVIAAAEGEGWSRELVRGALWYKPGNTLLQRFRVENPSVAPAVLKEPELSEIAAGIGSAFPSYQDLANVIANKLNQRLDLIIERKLGDPPPDVTVPLVQWFDRRGAVMTLIQTCLDARQEPLLVASAKKVLAAIKLREVAAGYRVADPYDTCLVDRRVFLDRQQLREALRAWSPPPRYRVVAVNGPSRSGKTYSLQLVRHIAVKIRSIQVASIDLGDENLELFLPGALARRIMLQMGRARDLAFMPKMEDAGSGPRWARELCDWLISSARESEAVWVIALDGTHQAQMRDETRDMIRELVKRASVADSPLRVVLLGYTDDLIPVDVRDQVAAEVLQVVTEKDLRDYLGKLVDQLGVDVEDGVIDQIVTDVIASTSLQSIELVAGQVQRWIDKMGGTQP